MRKIAVSILTVAALSSCSATGGLGAIDTAIRAGVPYLCSAAKPFHSAFLLSAATGKVKQSLIAKEAVAYEQLQTYCSGGNQDLVGALNAVTAAYLAIKNAAFEAKRDETGQ